MCKEEGPLGISGRRLGGGLMLNIYIKNIRICDQCNITQYRDKRPLWSSGQSFWLQIQRSRVRFPALSDFLSSSGSGTGSTQPREVH